MPTLVTLHQRPSWVSWSGRIDRSACAEVRVGEVWREVREWGKAWSKGGREARGSIVMNALWLRRLHVSRRPRQIEGDYRWKSHAMQPLRGWDRDKRWKRSLKDHALPGTGPERRKILIANPNRGACMGKMLGLPIDEWSQELTVERWCAAKVAAERIGPSNLKGSWDGRVTRFFLVCPGRDLGYRRVPVWRPDARRVTPTERQKWWWAIGREAWGEPCTGKCYKLFLPLCTRAELEDSFAAEVWLRRVEEWRRMRRVGPAKTVDEQVVAARYAPLFGPRRLVCGKCLGLHYGKVKNLMERWRESYANGSTHLRVGERRWGRRHLTGRCARQWRAS